MSTNRYRLGVSLHRRTPPLWLMLERRIAVTAVVVATVFGFGLTSAFGGLHVFSWSNDSGMSRKQNKTSINRTNRPTRISNTRTSELRVQPIATAASTSPTPSSVPVVQPIIQITDVATTPSPQLATADSSLDPAPPPVQPSAALPTASLASVQTSVALPTSSLADDTVSIAVSTTGPSLPTIVIPVLAGTDLNDPAKKDIAMQLVSSAENSSLNWKTQYGYIEDIGDGRGYTAGIIGFCSGTGDMLELVQYYTRLKPGNPLAAYLPALQRVKGSSSHTGLGTAYTQAWQAAASDPIFQQAQNDERDRVYFGPAVSQAKADGLGALGQFIYYDALVMHGPGDDAGSFGGIRATALKMAKTPAQGGDEATYLHAFLDARVAAMKTEAAHDDVSRVETAQRIFLQAGNFDLNTPLAWKVYGDSYTIN